MVRQNTRIGGRGVLNIVLYGEVQTLTLSCKIFDWNCILTCKWEFCMKTLAFHLHVPPSWKRHIFWAEPPFCVEHYGMYLTTDSFTKMHIILSFLPSFIWIVRLYHKHTYMLYILSFFHQYRLIYNLLNLLVSKNWKI